MAILNLTELAAFASALPLVDLAVFTDADSSAHTDTLWVNVKGTGTDFRIYGFNGDAIDDPQVATVYGAILTDGSRATPHEAASAGHAYYPGWATANRDDGLVYVELILWLRNRGIAVYHDEKAL